MPVHTPDSLLPLLQVVVRSAADVAEITIELAASGHEPVARVIAGDLRALYVIDTNDEQTPLTRQQLAALGLDEPHLHVASVRNLIALLQPIEREGDAGAWLLSEPGGLEECLLFVPAVWEWVAQWTNGAPVACQPSRDVVLVTGADDADGLIRLRTAARAVFDDDEYPISTYLLLWTGSGWVEFQP